MTKVFIDGSAGTTGLRIHERLSARSDLTLVTLPEETRKDLHARQDAINSADIAFLCLPDAAAREAVAAPKPEKPAAAPQPAREKAPVKRFSFKEQRDFDTIDGVIAELEGKLSDLAKQIEANSADYEKVMALMAEQEQTQSALDTAMERWMYLQERYEEIQAVKEGKA